MWDKNWIPIIWDIQVFRKCLFEKLIPNNRLICIWNKITESWSVDIPKVFKFF